MLRRPPPSTPFPYTTLFRSILDARTDSTDRVRAKSNAADTLVNQPDIAGMVGLWSYNGPAIVGAVRDAGKTGKVKIDRKSTRLNSSHVEISYAVFCLKKKKR